MIKIGLDRFMLGPSIKQFPTVEDKGDFKWAHATNRIRIELEWRGQEGEVKRFYVMVIRTQIESILKESMFGGDKRRRKMDDTPLGRGRIYNYYSNEIFINTDATGFQFMYTIMGLGGSLLKIQRVNEEREEPIERMDLMNLCL